MYSFLRLVSEALWLYNMAVLVWFVLGLLISFKIVNRSHPVVYRVDDFLSRIIEPVLKPIRKYLPPIGGIDLSPLVLILFIQFLQNLIMEYGFGRLAF